MQIIDDKALLLRVRHPGKITEIIPKSRQVGANEVLVHWGLDEAQVLRNVRIKAPSPIRAKYNWPGKFKPFKHQIDTAEFLTLNKKSYCFSEMGTGKTSSAIWAADFLMNERRVNRVLVICPLSIMDSAWRNEIFNCAMHRKVDVAHGSRAKREEIIKSDAEFVIINFDGLGIVEEHIKNGGFDLYIVDEASGYKNAQTQRWKTLNRIVKRTDWLWMMTGTPAAQSPLDAYGLAKLVDPTSVPQFFGTFREQVMSKITQFKWVPRPDAVARVHEILQPAIRFTKEQCLDLPEMTYVKRDVPLSPQQKKYYEKLRKELVVIADGEEITAANAAIAMNKLLQISSGCVYSEDKQVIEFDIKTRYKVLQEIIEETDNKVLVFAPFKHIIERLVGLLRADGLTAEMIRGDVPASKRTDIFNRFQQNSDPRILVIQPQAAAHGVTLTAANTVVWWGPTSSLEIYAQANARVHRTGQRNPCTVVQLQGSSVEKHVYSMLDNRIDVHSKITELYKKVLY